MWTGRYVDSILDLITETYYLNSELLKRLISVVLSVVARGGMWKLQLRNGA